MILRAVTAVGVGWGISYNVSGVPEPAALIQVPITVVHLMRVPQQRKGCGDGSAATRARARRVIGLWGRSGCSSCGINQATSTGSQEPNGQIWMGAPSHGRWAKGGSVNTDHRFIDPAHQLPDRRPRPTPSTALGATLDRFIPQPGVGARSGIRRFPVSCPPSHILIEFPAPMADNVPGVHEPVALIQWAIPAVHTMRALRQRKGCGGGSAATGARARRVIGLWGRSG